MRLLFCILGLLIPPLGLFLWFGAAALTWILSAVWLLGLLVFWFLWAGPGLGLCLFVSFCTVAAILFVRPSPSSPRAF